MSWYTKFRARCRSRWQPRLERRWEEAKLASRPKAPTQGTGSGKRASAGGGRLHGGRCKVEAKKPSKGVRDRNTFKCARRDQALKERGVSEPPGDLAAGRSRHARLNGWMCRRVRLRGGHISTEQA